MTQPNFVPITEADQVRPTLQLEVPGHWVPTRPAEIAVPRRRSGRNVGTPGPDQGFAIKLAHRFEDRLRLSPLESAEDVVIGCALVGSKRAALYGRAPSVYDVQVAYSIFGFLQDAPAGLVEARCVRFRSASHDYVVQRDIVDGVGDEVLALRPDQVEEWFTAGGWRQLFSDVGSPTG